MHKTENYKLKLVTMKKQYFLFLTMLLFSFTAQQAFAQNRKRTTTTKHVVKHSPTVTIPQKTSKAPAPLVKTIAAYSFRPKNVFIGTNYIFYIENSRNNAVMGIDQATGEVVEFVQGIATVYEEVRPTYSYIQSGGNYLFCGYGTDSRSVYHVYDITTKKLVKEIEDWLNIDAINDKYALIWPKRGPKELWDMTTLKRITTYPNDIKWGSDYKQKFFLASDGAVWFKWGEVYRVAQNGKVSVYDLSKEDYVIKNKINGIGHVAKKGDYLYVAAHRRIYRMNMLAPGHWTEYAKVPLTEDNSFYTFLPDSKGNLLTSGDSFYNKTDRCVERYVVGNFDNPEPMGHSIDTGLTEWGYKSIGIGGARTDNQDNVIVLIDSNKLFIYNPDGVVGYTKAIGKIVKLMQ